ncbi:transposase [Vogesella sp. XCS3]|uniref:transposase n=1 Tax=Vogesella sp. XCS3 TaxID=2877939 RepID=UPI00351D3BBC
MHEHTAFPPKFKDEAVKQATERSYSVAEASVRLGVSSHSLYKWVTAVARDNSEKQTAELIEATSEILRRKAQPRRTEERDILRRGSSRITGEAALIFRKKYWRSR